MACVKAKARRAAKEQRFEEFEESTERVNDSSQNESQDGAQDQEESCGKRLGSTVESIAKREYGDVIPHQDLGVLLGVAPKTLTYYQLVQRLNNRLLRMSKVLENVRGIGYRIVEPDNYTDLALERFSRAANQVHKATRVMKFAPVAKMSQGGRERFEDTSRQALKLKASFLSGFETTKDIAMSSGGILGDHPKDPGVVNRNEK